MGVYGFFNPDPIIEYVDGRHAHSFVCAATHFRSTSRHVRRFLNTKDAKSTSNLRRHALKCWGEDNLNAARSRLADEVREATKGATASGSITAAFEWKGKRKVSYSHRQHTRTKTKYVYKLTWGNLKVSSMKEIKQSRDRPLGCRELSTVKHCQGPWIPKFDENWTPAYWIPSPATVARDIKLAFAKTRNRIAKILKVRQLCTT